MDNRYALQLRHGVRDIYGKEYTTRDAVLKDVEGQISKLLPYEPVLFFYGEGENKSTMIVIGLPDGKTHNGKSFFAVDTDELQEQIDEIGSGYADEIDKLKSAIQEESKNREEKDIELQSNISDESKSREDADKELKKNIDEEVDARKKECEKLQSDIDFSKDDIKSVIDACGLLYNEKLADDRAKYEPDSHDETIRDAKSIADAIDKISKFAAKMAKDLKVLVADTETVSLAMVTNEKDGGNTITANVKLSEGGSMTDKTHGDDNILSVQKDGLFATVDLSYDENTHELTFRKSDSKKSDAVEEKWNLGNHTEYKADNDGHTVKMTVITNGNDGTISGDVEVSKDTHNKLEVKDNKLFVDDRAKSILVDEEGNVTLDKKLESIDKAIADTSKSLTDNKSAIDKEVEKARAAEEALAQAIETNEANIKKNTDAVIVINGNEAQEGSIKKTFKDAKDYADKVSADAKKEANTHADTVIGTIEIKKNDATDLQYVLFVNKENKGTIDIPKDQFLKDATYDPRTKEITLTFETKDGIKTTPINIADLVDTYKAGNGLSETNNIFSVKIDGDSEYLSVSDEGIKVQGIDKAIEAEKKRAEKAEGDNKSAIEDEARTARKAEGDNAKAIAAEQERAEREEKKNADDIAIIKGDENTDGSIKKALKEAKTYSDGIVAGAKAEANNHADEIVKAEAALAREGEKTLDGKIDAEIKRSTEKDEKFAESIGNNKSAIEGEIARAKGEEARIEGLIGGEKDRAQLAESGLEKQLTEQKEHIDKLEADAKDFVKTTEVDKKISEEVARADDKYATQIALKGYVETASLNELSDKVDTKANSNDIYTSAQTDLAITNALKPYTTQTYVDGKLGEKLGVSDAGNIYVNKTDLANTHWTSEETKNHVNEKITQLSGATKVELKALKEELDGDISLKADKANVFTKDDVNTRLNDYALKSDVVKKVNKEYAESTYEKKDDLNTTLESYYTSSAVDTKLDYYATTQALSELERTVATDDELQTAVNGINERLTTDEGKISKINLTYNSATSTLTYTDKENNSHTYVIGGSVVKDGTYNADTQSIVLTIQTQESTGSTERQIVIPVAQLLSSIDDRVTTVEGSINTINSELDKKAKVYEASATNTVSITKTVGGEKDTITADVLVSSATANAIKKQDSGLFVSSQLEDYTVQYGSEGRIGGNNAIAKLREATTQLGNKIDTAGGEVDAVKDDIADVKASMTTVNTQIGTLNTNVDTLRTNFTTLSATVTTHETRLGTIEGKVTSIETSIASLQTSVAELIELTQNLIDAGSYE